MLGCLIFFKFFFFSPCLPCLLFLGLNCRTAGWSRRAAGTFLSSQILEVGDGDPFFTSCSGLRRSSAENLWFHWHWVLWKGFWAGRYSFFSASGGANKSSFSVPVRCLIFLRSRSLSLPSRWYSIMLLFALQFDFWRPVLRAELRNFS